jgi:hypothetical protein
MSEQGRRERKREAAGFCHDVGGDGFAVWSLDGGAITAQVRVVAF